MLKDPNYDPYTVIGDLGYRCGLNPEDTSKAHAANIVLQRIAEDRGTELAAEALLNFAAGYAWGSEQALRDYDPGDRA